MKNKKLVEFTKKMGIFVAFQIIFAIITMPLLVFFGPFEKIKKKAVGSFVTTYSLDYLARVFLSEKAINRIMVQNTIKEEDIPIAETNTTEMISVGKISHDDKIDLFNIDGGTFQGKMIVIHDPLRIKVGYSSKMPKAGETTSAISRKSKAVAAINAGGFVDPGYSSAGGVPLGFIINNGVIVHDQIKNENRLQDTIAFDKNGIMIVGRYSIKQLKEMNVKEGVSFGPPLIVNGKPIFKNSDGGWGIAPRTAIGQRKDGAVMFIVIDGRSITSIGATLRDVQEVLREHGAVTAANLDGGSSSTMVANGKVINKPSDFLGERLVPTVFYAASQGNY